MQALLLKVIRKPWFFPLVLLGIGVLAYGLILQLKAEADAHGYQPDLAAETLPFIEAYAHTDQWQQATQLSQEAQQIGKGAGMALCNLWQAFVQFASGDAAQGIQQFCPAENP
jgi:hypothetical protein